MNLARRCSLVAMARSLPRHLHPENGLMRRFCHSVQVSAVSCLSCCPPCERACGAEFEAAVGPLFKGKDFTASDNLAGTANYPGASAQFNLCEAPAGIGSRICQQLTLRGRVMKVLKATHV